MKTTRKEKAEKKQEALTILRSMFPGKLNNNYVFTTFKFNPSKPNLNGIRSNHFIVMYVDKTNGRIHNETLNVARAAGYKFDAKRRTLVTQDSGWDVIRRLEWNLQQDQKYQAMLVHDAV